MEKNLDFYVGKYPDIKGHREYFSGKNQQEAVKYRFKTDIFLNQKEFRSIENGNTFFTTGTDGKFRLWLCFKSQTHAFYFKNCTGLDCINHEIENAPWIHESFIHVHAAKNDADMMSNAAFCAANLILWTNTGDDGKRGYAFLHIAQRSIGGEVVKLDNFKDFQPLNIDYILKIFKQYIPRITQNNIKIRTSTLTLTIISNYQEKIFDFLIPDIRENKFTIRYFNHEFCGLAYETSQFVYEKTNEKTLPGFKFWKEVNKIFSGDRLIWRAFFFAKNAHKGHKEKYTGKPYINHLFRVAKKAYGKEEFELYQRRKWSAIAFLHDTIEDTNVTLADIEREFGAEIAASVEALSDTTPLAEGNRAYRKKLYAAKIEKQYPAIQDIKCLDIIDNLESIEKFDKKFLPQFLQESIDMIEKFSNWGDMKKPALEKLKILS